MTTYASESEFAEIEISPELDVFCKEETPKATPILTETSSFLNSTSESSNDENSSENIAPKINDYFEDTESEIDESEISLRSLGLDFI